MNYASPMHAAIKQAIYLRYYQSNLCAEIEAQWDAGHKNVLAVLATGGGKTVVFGNIIARHRGASCAIAHRQELVSQMSLALARYGVVHKVIGSDELIRSIQRFHIEEVGTSFINPSSQVAVAGVDTLVRKGKLVKTTWLGQVTLLVHDEGHHLLKENKWGKATKLFTNVNRKLLSVTGTPERADGKGLGRHADGLIDVMVVGPGLRQLVDEGFLVPFRIVMAESDAKLTEEMFSKATGELNAKGVAAMRDSHIAANVVTAYLKHTPDERAIVFASDVETSTKMAEEFRRKGVAAMHIDGDTHETVRNDAIKKLKRGELQVLTNVGLFGEGFDLPVIVAVYDCAATESYPTYAQRFARMARLDVSRELTANWNNFSIETRKAHIAASNKPHGIYVDLVGNIMRHKGTPDKARNWTLDSRERRGGSSDATPTTYCANKDTGMGYACGNTYERYRTKCPFCGFKPEPAGRSTPEQVEGNTFELSPEALELLKGDIIDLNAPFIVTVRQPLIGQMAAKKRHTETVDAQEDLRDAFAWWAGAQRREGLTDPELFKLFYLTFKIDVYSSWALSATDAKTLEEKIIEELHQYVLT